MNIKSPLTRAEAVKTAVILQSNYVPWRGYFDLIREADIFIYYDEVQYTHHDWRNRNIIVSPQGTQWLTIPVSHSGNFGQKISQAKIADKRWARKHWSALAMTYRKSPGFKRWAQLLENTYAEAADKELLVDINRLFLEVLAKELDIGTEFVCSSQIPGEGERTERLVMLCQAVKAKRYLTGPAAKEYLSVQSFQDADIEVAWKTYPEYPSYMQLDGGYEKGVSILDTLFRMEGNNIFESLSHVA